MGVTIHFEGKLKDQESLERCMAIAEAYSGERGWPVVRIDRVRDEVACEGSVGPVRGIEMQPHEDSEPLRLEFGRDLVVQEYIKTQFAPIEVHVQVVELLRRIGPCFESLKVEDEGEYFESGELGVLRQLREDCEEAMRGYLAVAGDDGGRRYHGPVRLGSGRIVDLMER